MLDTDQLYNIDSEECFHENETSIIGGNSTESVSMLLIAVQYTIFIFYFHVDLIDAGVLVYECNVGIYVSI